MGQQAPPLHDDAPGADHEEDPTRVSGLGHEDVVIPGRRRRGRKDNPGHPFGDPGRTAGPLEGVPSGEALFQLLKGTEVREPRGQQPVFQVKLGKPGVFCLSEGDESLQVDRQRRPLHPPENLRHGQVKDV